MPANATQIEIMAPVGSMASLHAAVQAGADSVYFGIGKLNMRSKSSQNFTVENLHEISHICRNAEVKTYLTLNTVVYDDELEELQKLLQAAKQHHISAIIASDQAVIQKAREMGMAIHMSTQTNISNLEAVKYWSKYADVMVTARELNLDQVQYITEQIQKQNICGPSGKRVEIEVFVHGALCMAISGKCYLSLDNLNSSANRGACLQQCRRKYEVRDKEDGHILEVDHEYIMSPKDLCTLPFLDRLLAAGVRVLKIEGRGRSPEYVQTTVSVYREAVEAIQEGSFTAAKVEKLEKRLASVYNRGFWDGYYLGRKTGEWTEDYGSQATHQKVYVGKVTNYFSKLGVAEIKMETQSLELGHQVLFIGQTTGVLEQKIDEIRVDLKPVNSTIKGELASIPTHSLVRRGDKVYRFDRKPEKN